MTIHRNESMSITLVIDNLSNTSPCVVFSISGTGHHVLALFYLHSLFLAPQVRVLSNKFYRPPRHGLMRRIKESRMEVTRPMYYW